MVFLFSDVLYRAGGIETYLHALATHLRAEGRVPFRVAVAELEPCPLIEQLQTAGVTVYRQPRLPGDRWLVRQHALLLWLAWHLRSGDWVFCVRRPAPALYPLLVRVAHARGARLAVSWELPPADIMAPPTRREALARAIAATDAVISTHHATLGQFRDVYGYTGPVRVVPYHNLPIFLAPVPLPPGPPWKIGFTGRLDIRQKNLDVILRAVAQLRAEGEPVELHLHGGGGDEAKLHVLAEELAPVGGDAIHFHGAYDHQRDLPGIIAANHFFIYASRFEGLPLTLLELLQAGRYVVTSRVGGIPDLYENHPEAGDLTDPGDPDALPAALHRALRLAAAGALDPRRIRQRHDGRFDLVTVHQAWREALDLPAA